MSFYCTTRLDDIDMEDIEQDGLRAGDKPCKAGENAMAMKGRMGFAGCSARREVANGAGMTLRRRREKATT